MDESAAARDEDISGRKLNSYSSAAADTLRGKRSRAVGNRTRRSMSKMQRTRRTRVSDLNPDKPVGIRLLSSEIVNSDAETHDGPDTKRRRSLGCPGRTPVDKERKSIRIKYGLLGDDKGKMQL